MTAALLAEVKEARLHVAKLDEFLDRLEAATEAAAKPVEVPLLLAKDKGLQNSDAFFDYIRGDEGELFPRMMQKQLDGILVLLGYAAGKLPLSWCAYCLATDYHETARTMQGVKEAFNLSEDWRKRHLRYYPYYGRGLVQLTWDYNYRRAGEHLGIDLLGHPDLALEIGNAVRIMVDGMLEGWFTDKKLRDFLPAAPTRENYKHARQIINKMDKADLIAGYAIEFEKALKLGEWR